MVIGIIIEIIKRRVDNKLLIILMMKITHSEYKKNLK